ncbi:hypothetical protein [Aeromonas cavernicola]|uniref:Uncharacterized protein n=1 Tax=Aeromonas cavernicola TaxID=1006623 RepID=A0A2H9U2P7_9GAMM|nr:hypothetical protein [Aeromonas cavernicola]PJG58327.1 hypothetical protein CUC53_13210 [Aeromonas cavernicola]
MNKRPDNTIIVTDINSNKIKLIANNEQLVSDMNNIGFTVDGDYMVQSFSTENDIVSMINRLIDREVLFLFGYGWYPSEIVGFYKDRNMVSKSYKVISWRDPDNFVVENIPS